MGDLEEVREDDCQVGLAVADEEVCREVVEDHREDPEEGHPEGPEVLSSLQTQWFLTGLLPLLYPVNTG